MSFKNEKKFTYQNVLNNFELILQILNYFCNFLKFLHTFQTFYVKELTFSVDINSLINDNQYADLSV